jgi:hypothetical protein
MLSPLPPTFCTLFCTSYGRTFYTNFYVLSKIWLENAEKELSIDVTHYSTFSTQQITKYKKDKDHHGTLPQQNHVHSWGTRPRKLR